MLGFSDLIKGLATQYQSAKIKQSFAKQAHGHKSGSFRKKGAGRYHLQGSKK
jgi:hypothetical protein